MKMYVTAEPVRKLKGAFTNMNTFYVIDVDDLVARSGLDVGKESHRFLINKEIEGLIVAGAKSKRYNGIMYINSNIGRDVIDGIRKSIGEITNSRVDGIALLDDYDTPKMKRYYGLFDEVIFFTTFRKMKIIECRPLESSAR